MPFPSSPTQNGGQNLAQVPDVTMAQALLPDQGNNLSLWVDPSWPHRFAWERATNQSLSLPFTFLDLESGIDETAGPTYSTTDIIGRPEAYKTYMGTANRQIHLNFQFHAQGLGWTQTTVDGPIAATVINDEVIRPTRWLDSLRYPFVDEHGISHAPPPCILVIGQLLLIRVIVEDAAIKWMGPWEPKTNMPHASEVSCIFTAVHPSFGNYQSQGPTRFQDFNAGQLSSQLGLGF